MMQAENIGSNFDDFLHEEGLLDEANAVAIKRVIAWQDRSGGEGAEADVIVRNNGAEEEISH